VFDWSIYCGTHTRTAGCNWEMGIQTIVIEIGFVHPNSGDVT